MIGTQFTISKSGRSFLQHSRVLPDEESVEAFRNPPFTSFISSNHMVPKEVDFDMLVKLAVICDKYIRYGNRAAQTGVFDLDIRIFNRLFIDVCTSCAAETGLKYRNIEKRINAV
jgi:hypothetical protein